MPAVQNADMRYKDLSHVTTPGRNHIVYTRPPAAYRTTESLARHAGESPDSRTALYTESSIGISLSWRSSTCRLDLNNGTMVILQCCQNRASMSTLVGAFVCLPCVGDMKINCLPKLTSLQSQIPGKSAGQGLSSTDLEDEAAHCRPSMPLCKLSINGTRRQPEPAEVVDPFLATRMPRSATLTSGGRWAECIYRRLDTHGVHVSPLSRRSRKARRNRKPKSAAASTEAPRHNNNVLASRQGCRCRLHGKCFTLPCAQPPSIAVMRSSEELNGEPGAPHIRPSPTQLSPTTRPAFPNPAQHARASAQTGYFTWPCSRASALPSESPCGIAAGPPTDMALR